MSISPASIRATSSASIPAGVIPYGVPVSINASHSGSASRRVQPDLEAEVAGVAGAGDGDREDPRSFAAVILKYFKSVKSVSVSRWRISREAGPCKRKGRGGFGDVVDGDFESDGVGFQPAQVRVGRGHAEHVLVEAGDRAVVEHFPGGVAPRRVEHLPHLRAARRRASPRDRADARRPCPAPGTCTAARRRAARPRSGWRGTRARARARTSWQRRSRPSAATRGSGTSAAVRA